MRWSVPDTLSGCVLRYTYTLKISNFTGALPLESSHSLEDISRNVNNPCNADFLTVIPFIKAYDKPLISSGVSQIILGGKELLLLIMAIIKQYMFNLLVR